MGTKRGARGERMDRGARAPFLRPAAATATPAAGASRSRVLADAPGVARGSSRRCLARELASSFCREFVRARACGRRLVASRHRRAAAAPRSAAGGGQQPAQLDQLAKAATAATTRADGFGSGDACTASGRSSCFAGTGSSAAAALPRCLLSTAASRGCSGSPAAFNSLRSHGSDGAARWCSACSIGCPGILSVEQRHSERVQAEPAALHPADAAAAQPAAHE